MAEESERQAGIKAQAEIANRETSAHQRQNEERGGGEHGAQQCRGEGPRKGAQTVGSVSFFNLLNGSISAKRNRDSRIVKLIGHIASRAALRLPCPPPPHLLYKTTSRLLSDCAPATTNDQT